tara:strand:+ start:162 stop:524 length:363 start_codon:yes stop_codon:yes gene_type:complete
MQTKNKIFLNISEVSKLLDLEEHVIRHWDSRIDGLSTRMSENGNRFFNKDNIKKLEDLKNVLYSDGRHVYSLDLANKIINSKKYQKNLQLEKKSSSDQVFEKTKKIEKILYNLKNFLDRI